MVRQASIYLDSASRGAGDYYCRFLPSPNPKLPERHMTSEPQNFPVIRGRTIHVDDKGFVCLNDIWTAAGFSARQKPADWRELATTARLIVALLDQNAGKTGVKNYNP